MFQKTGLMSLRPNIFINTISLPLKPLPAFVLLESASFPCSLHLIPLGCFSLIRKNYKNEYFKVLCHKNIQITLLLLLSLFFITPVPFLSSLENSFAKYFSKYFLNIWLDMCGFFHPVSTIYPLGFRDWGPALPSSIHFWFNKYLLKTYYVLDPVPLSECVRMKKQNR